MKRIALTLIAASLAAGTVSAADLGAKNEHPEAPARPTAAAQTVTLDARAIHSAKELQRAGLKSLDKVTVTNFSSSTAKNSYER